MFRKVFISAFLVISFTALATPCDTIKSLVIPDTVTVCKWDTVHLPLSATLQQESLHYQWSNETNRPFLLVLNGVPAGEVWVEISDDAQTCTHRDTFVVEIRPAPEIAELRIDTTLCVLGDTLKLNAGKTPFTTSSQWVIKEGVYSSDSIFNVVFDTAKLSTQIYFYVVRRLGHCLSGVRHENLMAYNVYDTIAAVFFANKPSVDFGPDTTYCEDDRNIVLTPLADSLFLNERYHFQWHDHASSNTFSINSEKKGLIFVNIWNEVCRDTVTDSIKIDFYPKKWTESGLISDTTICQNEQIYLDATVAEPNQTTYLWTFDSITADSIIVVNKGGTYTVIITDSAGCVREFSCEVSEDDCAPKVEMPNVFTPNGDGINELFKPIVHERLYDFRLRIYSRWGREVYKFSGDPSEAQWNGKNGNTDVPDGVYFWVIKYTDWRGKKYDGRGTVTILRSY